MLKGIDVSEMNGHLDWNIIKNYGIDFAILRIGYGSDFRDQDDTEFAYNVSQCEALKIPYGVYLFSYADSVAKAASEAQHTIRLINSVGAKPAWGIWYDVEDGKTMQTGSLMQQIVETYLGTVSSLCFTVGLYASLSVFENSAYFGQPCFDKYEKWVAQYNSICEYQKPYGIWQHTSTGRINGLGCNFDFNIAYKDYGNKGDIPMSKQSRVLGTGANVITNPYGNGHGGVDVVKAPMDLDTVIAHTDGVVIFCQTGIPNDTNSSGNRSYGNCVKIKHDNGYFTLYAHMDSVNVSNRQRVSKGDKIGFMGNTGNSYGAHLHFEVRDTNDDRINPEPYLNADLPNSHTEPDEPQEPLFGTGEYKVTAELLNVRKGPSTSYGAKSFSELTENAQKQILSIERKPVDGLVAGVITNVTDVSGEWGNTASGWINMKYVTPNTPATKIDCFYSVYADGYWLPEVKNGEDYAGNIGSPFSGLYFNVSGGDRHTRVHLKNSNRWLPEVTTDYAGNLGEEIDGVQIRSNRKLSCKVHVVGGDWLPPVVFGTGYGKTEGDGFAGIFGKAIDAIMIEVIE